MIRLTATILAIFIGMTSISAIAENDSVLVPKTYDMQELGRYAKQTGVPILIEFALVHCEYCKRLEADYLSALSQNREYQSKLIIRKVIIDEERTLSDFSGSSIEMKDFVKRYGIIVTPTLVFIDGNGNAIGRKLVGYQETGFFGGHLDNAIEIARQQLRE